MASNLLIFCVFLLFALVSAALPEMSIIDYNAEHRTEIEVRAMYESWLVTHGKAYNALGEKERRFEIFKDNLMFIDQHNRANRTYRVGLNRFADLTNEEYRVKYLGLKIGDQNTRLSSPNVSYRYAFRAGDELPDSVDWREKGAIPAVKDQGQCGSSWAFAAITAVEAINKIVTGDLITLSEQELIECDKMYNQGCDGGVMDDAFEFIVNNEGIDSDEDYPYTGLDGQCDKNKKNAHAVTIDSYKYVPWNDEQSLKKAVANQPISVAIEAGGKEFQLYESGVFTGQCGTDLDHGVVVVGYDTKDGLDFWILRESRGEKWGEDGYMRMERNLAGSKSGKCGIAIYPTYPVKNGANPQTRCDNHYSCPPGNTCCCVSRHDNMCSKWGCCPLESATCCDNNGSCCPHDYPVCDPDGTCRESKNSLFGVKAFKQAPARGLHNYLGHLL